MWNSNFPSKSELCSSYMINMSLTEANFSGENANMAEDVIVIPISKNFESISGKVLAKNTHEEAIGI